MLILRKFYHLLFPGDIDRINKNKRRWAETICRSLGLDVDHGEFLPCFGFIDGTAKRINRPAGVSVKQQAMYDGHHRFHGFEYQGITTPDGIVIMLFGPVPGRMNDLYMVKASNLEEMFEGEFRVWEEGGEQYFVYGDQGYMTTPFVLAGKKDPSKLEAKMNRAWSDERVTVEWTFGSIIALWQSIDCFRMQKAQQRLVAVWYLVSVLLTNCYVCVRGKSEVSQHFDQCPTPTLEEYLTPCSEKFEEWRERYHPHHPTFVSVFGDDDPEWGHDQKGSTKEG